MSNNEAMCKHSDIRTFDNIRCCLSCGTSIVESPQTYPEESAAQPLETIARQEYIYNDLNFDLGQEIRLIILLPGLPSETLRCEIIHVNLDNDPNYEAVSYAWATDEGDDQKREIIQCPCRGIIQITTNCASSLKQLRYTTRKRRLWVDALCIHQANIRERMHQVQLMGQIYSKALRVLICITYPFHDYSHLYQYLRDGSMFASLGYEIRSVLSRRWFSRVWVIQEVALARSVMMVCNKYSILLTQEVISRFATYLRAGEELPSPLNWSPGSQMGRDIYTCLQATRLSSATDPRDKIYGILNLLDPESRSLIDVDYSLDVGHVYAKAAIAVVKQQQTLDILSHAFISKYNIHERHYATNELGTITSYGTYDNDLRLASWVPDWRRIRHDLSHQFHMDILGPWTSNIKVAEYDERELGEAIVPVDPEPNVQIIISNIATRFCVRAHYIDSIDKPLWMSDISLGVFYEMTGFSQNEFVAPGDTQQFTLKDDNQWLVASQKALQPHMFGEQNFSTVLDDWQQRYARNFLSELVYINKGEPYGLTFERYPFRTRRSIGYVQGTKVDFSWGCYDIFAIDGARNPFLLQKVAPGMNSYRLVADCHLLAALEPHKLDASDSKGLFNDQQESHPLQGWSGMIELV